MSDRGAAKLCGRVQAQEGARLQGNATYTRAIEGLQMRSGHELPAVLNPSLPGLLLTWAPPAPSLDPGTMLYCHCPANSPDDGSIFLYSMGASQ